MSAGTFAIFLALTVIARSKFRVLYRVLVSEPAAREGAATAIVWSRAALHDPQAAEGLFRVFGETFGIPREDYIARPQRPGETVESVDDARERIAKDMGGTIASGKVPGAPAPSPQREQAEALLKTTQAETDPEARTAALAAARQEHRDDVEMTAALNKAEQDEAKLHQKPPPVVAPPPPGQQVDKAIREKLEKAFPSEPELSPEEDDEWYGDYN